MADIQSYLDEISNARYGKDVRKAIHDGVKAINEEVGECSENVTTYTGQIGQLSSEIDDINQALGYATLHSNNMLIANEVVNKPFSEVFTSSAQVDFSIGTNGEYWGDTGQLTAIVVFTDNTVGSLGLSIR